MYIVTRSNIHSNYLNMIQANNYKCLTKSKEMYQAQKINIISDTISYYKKVKYDRNKLFKPSCESQLAIV